MFLQRNSNQLRDLNLSHFNDRSGCNSCQDYHVDPNGHDRYWSNYRAWLAGDKPTGSEEEAVRAQPQLFQEQEEQLLGEQESLFGAPQEEEAVFRAAQEEAVFRAPQEEEAVFRAAQEEDPTSMLEQQALARRMQHHQQMMRQRQMEIARQQAELERMQEEEVSRMEEEEQMGRF